MTETIAKKDKIAICVSGQTRAFNEHPKYTQDFLNILDLFSEYDYDLFGHTWADQEDPHAEVLDKFTEYRSDDQEIIWDEIINYSATTHNYFPVWTQFFQTQPRWYHKPEYMDMLKGKSTENYIDFAKERIYGTVGQVWSAHECFLLLKNHIQNKYRFVVRLRWDLDINSIHGHEYINYKKHTFKDILHNWSYKKFEWATTDKGRHLLNVSCLSANDCAISYKSIPFINDQLFIFDAETLYQNLILDPVAKKPVHLLSKLLQRNQHPDNNLPIMAAAHSLWLEWILHAGFIVAPVLPNITQANGRNNNKVNKDWNI
jgi:hypothetical protein